MSPTSPSSPPAAAFRRPALLASLILGLLTLAAYHQTFSVPFVFDDIPSIVENRSLRRLWPLGEVLVPDQAGGVTSSGRPLVNLSFALNYAVSGLAVGSYHAVNLAIHVAAGLCLFGLVRRTLLAPRLQGRFGGASAWLGFLSAALWLLHPLQTESVTYVVQRAEALMGLCYLLTLYAFVRGGVDGGSRGWLVVSVAACLLGMASKEVMVSAPLVVLAYDGTFWSASWGAALRRRGRYYAGLAATWILLVLLVAGTGSRGGTAGFATGVSAGAYALTQARAVVHYVLLSIWPQPLVFDYGLAVERSLLAVLPQVLILAAALAATMIALRRRSIWGFAGLAYFAVLAPSSSFVPVATQTMAEHRMYLPLAILVTTAVLGVFALTGARGLAVLAGAGVALGGATLARNHAYRSEETLWLDTATKQPANARAHNNLGQALFRAGRIADSIRCYERALALQPSYPETHYNLGVALARQERLEPAIAHYESALRIQARYPEAHNNLGNALVRAGRPAEAVPHYEAALAQDGGFAEAANNLGNALLALGQAAAAAPQFERALRLRPEYPEARYNLGNARAAGGDMAGALAQYRLALQQRPDYAEAHVNAGNALLALDRAAEALAHYERAVAAHPELADAQFNLGSALLQLERWRDAVPVLAAVLRLAPGFPGAERALGVALYRSGRAREAIPHFELHLRAHPRDEAAQAELAQVRAELEGASRPR